MSAPELQQDPPIAGVNIVPVIDLCLVLLVILLITSPILDQPGLKVELPKAVTVESKEKNISVTCSKDGRIAVNTDVIEPSELREKLGALLKQNPETLVIVRADQGSTYGVLTDVLSQIKGMGARRLAIGTEQKLEKH